MAGPTRQEGKPVGLVFVAVAGPDGVRTERLDLDGERAEIREQTVSSALALVLEAVSATRSVPGARVTDRRLPDEKFPSGGSVEVDHGSRRW